MQEPSLESTQESTPFAATPSPPYYAVIFTSRRTAGDRGYGAMSELMVRLASEQEGFLGVESVRDADGVGITVSYWRDEAAIRGWHRETRHRAAQRLGHERWYERFELRVCRVERAYSGPDADGYAARAE